MKTINRLLAGLLAAVLALGGLAAAETAERPMASAGDAEEWVRTLLGETPEALDGAWQMTGQMKTALTLSGGTKALAASLAGLGAVRAIGPAYEGTIQGRQAYYVPCVFAAMKLDLIIVTDQNVIAGVVTGAYTDDREQPSTAGNLDAVDLALPVPALSGALPGTLTVPKGEGPFPAVVLVHGSGPNDRDESLMNLKPFRDLAEGLAERGIAVYRYDKRTYVYGAEMAADRRITLVEETIEDAAAAVQLLARQDWIDPERIFVLGHSLGANAVPAIDRALRGRPVPARGYIMMAGSPRPLDVLMREQIDFLYSLMPEVTPGQQAEKDRQLAELDRLQDLGSLTDDDTVSGAYTPYWRWLAGYDALAAAREITAPCLLLQGEEDYQVTMTDFGIWQEAFGGKAGWRLIAYPGLTHCFTPGRKAEGSTAYLRAEHVAAQVLDDIAAFVLAQ